LIEESQLEERQIRQTDKLSHEALTAAVP